MLAELIEGGFSLCMLIILGVLACFLLILVRDVEIHQSYVGNCILAWAVGILHELHMSTIPFL